MANARDWKKLIRVHLWENERKEYLIEVEVRGEDNRWSVLAEDLFDDRDAAIKVVSGLKDYYVWDGEALRALPPDPFDLA